MLEAKVTDVGGVYDVAAAVVSGAVAIAEAVRLLVEYPLLSSRRAQKEPKPQDTSNPLEAFLMPPEKQVQKNRRNLASLFRQHSLQTC